MKTNCNDCKCETITELHTILPTDDEIGNDEELREHVNRIRRIFGELAEREELIQDGEELYWKRHPIHRWWHKLTVRHFGASDYNATARMAGMLHANWIEDAKTFRGEWY